MGMKLTDARRSLMKAKDAAYERLKQIDDERLEVKASIRSLDAALRALDGKRTKGAKQTGQEAANSQSPVQSHDDFRKPEST